MESLGRKMVVESDRMMSETEIFRGVVLTGKAKVRGEILRMQS